MAFCNKNCGCGNNCCRQDDHGGECDCDEHNVPKKIDNTSAIEQTSLENEFWVLAPCVECGNVFSVRKSRRDSVKDLFCSIECCKIRWKRTHVIRTCESCGKEFERPQSVKQTRFCSWQCYRDFVGVEAHGNYSGMFGYYQSIKAGNVHFDSRLELMRMKELDQDNSVRTWSRSVHRIPWVDSLGKQRLYYPDFDVEYVDGTKCVEELKGYYDLGSKMKIDAGKLYFASLSMCYRVLNLRDINEHDLAYEQYVNDYGTYTRPTFESTFMTMARIFRDRSTCVRHQVGAVFTNSEFTRVLCFGYNGGVKHDDNQCESLEPGKCGCIHAEVNAMVKSSESLNGSCLFVTTAPCKACAKLLINSGVQRVFYEKTYRDKSGILLLKKHHVEVIKWSQYVELCDRTFVGNQFKHVISKPNLSELTPSNDECLLCYNTKKNEAILIERHEKATR